MVDASTDPATRVQLDPATRHVFVDTSVAPGSSVDLEMPALVQGNGTMRVTVADTGGFADARPVRVFTAGETADTLRGVTDEYVLDVAYGAVEFYGGSTVATQTWVVNDT